ncbi:MAG: tyrosinase family protein [Acidobacteriota bacterium]
MKIRKNALYLSATERDNFLSAVLTLKNTIANPAAPAAQQISIWDQFVALHFYVFSITVPGEAFPVNVGHQNAGFGPWHRYYLLRLEQALQAAIADPTLTLPYWDWTDPVGTQNVLFQDNFLSPNGGAGGIGGGTVQSGYFAFNAPGALPPWWPAGLPGWRIRADLDDGLATTLRRNLQAFANLPDQADIDNLLSKPSYEGAGQFRQTLEQSPLHNFIHNWVSGHMGGGASPNDPIFFMHHCNVDRLWAMWQIDGHQGAAFYPAAGEPNSHNLNDPLWPWVGALTGYSPSTPLPDIVLPDFSGEPQRTPSDVLDHHALGYAYDTEPVIGLALDQTGSMTGLTPDPLTGMPPNIPKWDAAKQGVSFFLQDCEAAYAAREAYVTAGVQTFRTLAGNQFTKVFTPGPPYGLIKNGGGFSRATFDANIAAQSPAGGTPIAGALSDTESTLVRPPFGNLPANQRRYLAILTDGIETAAPLLSTLAAGEFPDTVILAMGFGIGGGWNGVDYATLANIVSKGITDPNIPDQVFHGESAAVIDKFYTNSLAISIGYTPAVDPLFDLFPGEHVHFNFDVTDAEHSFMIAAQGFDFNDRNWDFCLMGPDGTHCCDTRATGLDGGHPHDDAPHEGHHTPEHAIHHAEPKHASHHAEPVHNGHHHEPDCPYFLTLRKQDGRCTIFVNRNGTPAAKWVGRWALMAFYRPSSGKPVMIMPSVSDLLTPTGAPPVRGPLYLRFNQPVARRTPVRLLPGKPAHRLALNFPALSAKISGDPCALSIQIYHRTTLRPRLAVSATSPFAGEDFELLLNLNAPSGGKLSEVVTAARLVAPAFSIGNAFADPQTIPVKDRKRYLVAGQTQPAFNELQFLADYEKAKPGAFALRDEEVVFKRGRGGAIRAKIAANRHPGVYRVAVYVEGVVTLPHGECCHDGPQRFSRVLHAEVALGIRPDAAKSRPTLFWTAPDRFTVSVTPTDSLGNVIVPSRATAPEVAVNGKSARGTFENPYTGELRVEFRLQGDGLQPNKDGQSLAAKAWIVDDKGNRQIEIAPNKKPKVALTVGTVSMPVELPAFVGDRESRRAYPAGSPEAMRILLENRVTFASEKKARDASYKL